MNVSSAAGSVQNLILQRLFGSVGAKGAHGAQGLNGPPPFDPAKFAGQGSSGSGANGPQAAGFAAPQLSSGSLEAAISLQAGQPPPPPSSADAAASLIKAFDTDGDGSPSADEIKKGLEKAGSTASSGDIGKAFAKLDTSGDGKLSADELAKGLESARGAGRANHHHHAAGPGQAPPSAESIAAGLLKALDSDGKSGLSLDEVTKALGENGNKDDIAKSFAKLDSNGDGAIDASELTTAVKSLLATRERAYTQAASAGASSGATA